jgi:hypothetical protein
MARGRFIRTCLPASIVLTMAGAVAFSGMASAQGVRDPGVRGGPMRPPNTNGVAAEIETGLVINFMQTGAVRYRLDNRFQ